MYWNIMLHRDYLLYFSGQIFKTLVWVLHMFMYCLIPLWLSCRRDILTNLRLHGINQPCHNNGVFWFPGWVASFSFLWCFCWSCEIPQPSFASDNKGNRFGSFQKIGPRVCVGLFGENGNQGYEPRIIDKLFQVQRKPSRTLLWLLR